MPDYRFTIRGDQAPHPTTVSLPDDNSAWDYAEAIVRGFLSREAIECEAWMMEITQGEREVASIDFGLKAFKERRSIQ